MISNSTYSLLLLIAALSHMERVLNDDGGEKPIKMQRFGINQIQTGGKHITNHEIPKSNKYFSCIFSFGQFIFPIPPFRPHYWQSDAHIPLAHAPICSICFFWATSWRLESTTQVAIVNMSGSHEGIPPMGWPSPHPWKQSFRTSVCKTDISIPCVH